LFLFFQKAASLSARDAGRILRLQKRLGLRRDGHCVCFNVGLPVTMVI